MDWFVVCTFFYQRTISDIVLTGKVTAKEITSDAETWMYLLCAGSATEMAKV